MTVFSAQRFLILSSLTLVGALLLFYITAPSMGFPLEYDQAIRLVQINTPLLFGYLGSATQFLFTGDATRATIIKRELAPMLGILVVGPMVIFAIATASCLFAFAWSNRPSAAAGVGMSVDNLSILLTAILGLLAVTTSIIVSYLFSISEKQS